jgi:hypothetical protein
VLGGALFQFCGGNLLAAPGHLGAGFVENGVQNLAEGMQGKVLSLKYSGVVIGGESGRGLTFVTCDC